MLNIYAQSGKKKCIKRQVSIRSEVTFIFFKICRRIFKTYMTGHFWYEKSFLRQLFQCLIFPCWTLKIHFLPFKTCLWVKCNLKVIKFQNIHWKYSKKIPPFWVMWNLIPDFLQKWIIHSCTWKLTKPELKTNNVQNPNWIIYSGIQ